MKKFKDWDSADDLAPFESGKYKKTRAVAKKCYETHPEIPVLNGIVYGGNCSTPKIEDADIYVGLDYTMALSSPKYPWHPQEETKSIDIHFKMVDGSAPSDAKEFDLMVDWLIEQLKAGKRIHIGCIGGHGRTGTLISAIICKATGEKDAIKWVRENYCKKAVESKAQVDFLHKKYGITKQPGSRGEFRSTRSSQQDFLDWNEYSRTVGTGTMPDWGTPRRGVFQVSPLVSKNSIFGPKGSI